MCEAKGSQTNSYFTMDGTLAWIETIDVTGPTFDSDCCAASTGADDPR